MPTTFYLPFMFIFGICIIKSFSLLPREPRIAPKVRVILSNEFLGCLKTSWLPSSWGTFILIRSLDFSTYLSEMFMILKKGSVEYSFSLTISDLCCWLSIIIPTLGFYDAEFIMTLDFTCKLLTEENIYNMCFIASWSKAVK